MKLFLLSLYFWIDFLYKFFFFFWDVVGFYDTGFYISGNSFREDTVKSVEFIFVGGGYYFGDVYYKDFFGVVVFYSYIYKKKKNMKKKRIILCSCFFFFLNLYIILIIL